MRIIYVDCTTGISGEALLGALVDLGIDREQLFKELQHEFTGTVGISFQKNTGKGVLRTVLRLPEDRHTLTVNEFIKMNFRKESAEKSPSSFAKKVLNQYTAARSRLEDLPPEETLLSKKEAINMAVLAAGTFAALKQLEFPLVISSPVPAGAPVRAGGGNSLLALELAKGAAVRGTDGPAPFVTPTGVAILRQITDQYGQMPEMVLVKAGCGAPADCERGGIVRVLYGTGMIENTAFGKHETVLVIETGIDDMNPEFFPYLIERLLAAGALDAFLIPVYMKKGRPANLLKVLCRKEKLEEVLRIIFGESTTLGVRIHEETRRVLHRNFFKVQTPYGEVTVKAGYAETGKAPLQVAPEFEDCKKIAAGTGSPVKEVYAAAQRAAFEKIKNKY